MSALVFEYHNPTRVVFGWGAVEENLATEAGALGLDKIAVVTDKGVREAGLLHGVLSALKKAGVEARVFDDVRPNPTLENARDGVAFCRDNGCGAVLAVGGGSSMDAAKAIAILLAHGGDVADYQGMGMVPGPTAPLLCIPTTAGTGSEVTFYAVITDMEQHIKLPVVSPHIAPSLALVDPALTEGLPPFQTAATGMDAMTHCVESMISIKRDPVSEAVALSAIGRIAANLRTAVHTPENRSAREQMALAAVMGGMAFNNPVVTGAHAVAHSLGGLFGVPHGAACAMALPLVMEHNLYACPEIFVKIAAALGVDVRSLTAREAGLAAVREIRALNEDTGIPASLARFNIDPSQAGAIVENALMDASIAFNPRPFEPEALEALVGRLF